MEAFDNRCISVPIARSAMDDAGESETAVRLQSCFHPIGPSWAALASLLRLVPPAECHPSPSPERACKADWLRPACHGPMLVLQGSYTRARRKNSAADAIFLALSWGSPKPLTASSKWAAGDPSGSLLGDVWCGKPWTELRSDLSHLTHKSFVSTCTTWSPKYMWQIR